MKDELFDEDDFGGEPEDPTIKGNQPQKIKMPEIEMSIPLNDMRNLQKRDVISDGELYETELGINEKNILVSNEKFDGKINKDEIPIVPPVKEVIDESKKVEAESPPKKTYSFQQDENHPIPTKSIPSEPPKIKDISEEETSDSNADEEIKEEKKSFFKNILPSKMSADDLDEDADSKEYISRHDIIYTEKKDVARYEPPVRSPEYDDDEEDDETSPLKNAIAMIFMVLLGIALCVGTYLFVSGGQNVPGFIYNLTDEDRTILTEEYFFISSTSEYLTEINKLVDDEKQVIDSYVSGIIGEKEAMERLNTSLLAKQNLNSLYVKITPVEKEVIETKKLSDKIFNNTIAYTEDAILSVKNNDSKSRMVANFNTHVEENNSNIYMYNQYVMSVFKKRNITITYDGVNFAMDTKWLDKN